jgi:hypothetical protein
MLCLQVTSSKCEERPGATLTLRIRKSRACASLIVKSSIANSTIASCVIFGSGEQVSLMSVFMGLIYGVPPWALFTKEKEILSAKLISVRLICETQFTNPQPLINVNFLNRS